MKYKIKDFGVPATTSEYNSNNSWGFGGARGLNYVFAPNLSCLIAWAGTRHRGEFPFITVHYNSVRILDRSGHGKGAFTKAKELIHICLILNILSENTQTTVRKRTKRARS